MAEKKSRFTRCHECHTALGTTTDEECDTCGWLICPKCGSCAPQCGSDKPKADENDDIDFNNIDEYEEPIECDKAYQYWERTGGAFEAEQEESYAFAYNEEPEDHSCY